MADTLLDERFADNPQVAGDPGVRFYAGFPLRLRDGACVGSLCLIDYAPREFTAADSAVLADLSALAEDEFAAVSAATTDELTGLFNRRGFNQFAQFALSVSQRRAEPLTLGWLDLDHFKTINDRFGHQEGDKALKAMAALMRSSFREADMLVRFGGDEFAVLFADTDEPGAWIAMQYLSNKRRSITRVSCILVVTVLVGAERVRSSPQRYAGMVKTRGCANVRHEAATSRRKMT